MAPLALGTHQTIIYSLNEGPSDAPIKGTLMRYDTETGRKTAFFSVTNAHVDQTQVSADGQWVLFSTPVSNRTAIELVRMDGQALQTLYCSADGIGALQWSPDQKYLAFREGRNVSLLTVDTGAYQLELPSSAPQGIPQWYIPRTWLDNTRLYLYRQSVETPPLNLFLLDVDTAKVQPVLPSSVCGDFDSSIDGTQLFTTTSPCALPMTGGPSKITIQPATGGETQTIYSAPTYEITALRVASRTSLLFVIKNVPGVGKVDFSQNGLWKVNIDGTGLTRLTSDTADQTTLFNPFTQFIWSTVSRDKAFYAGERRSGSPPLYEYALEVGSLSGGTPTVFAPPTEETQLALVGWTTM
jgi:hypothetical protein